MEFNFKGYETDKGCDICGAKPAIVEPRFLYATCEEHSNITPTQFAQAMNAHKPAEHEERESL